MIPIADILNQAIASIPEGYLYEPNLKLIFEIGTGAFTTDSVGNDIEVKRTLVLLASVREASARDRATQQAGADFAAMYLDGRLSNPKTIPDGITLEDTAVAEYSYAVNPLQPSAKTTVSGSFRFTASLQDRYPAITAKLGTRITGFLTLRGGS